MRTTTQNPSSTWLSVPAENATARGSPSRCIRSSSCSTTARSLDHPSTIVRCGADYRLRDAVLARDATAAPSGGWRAVSRRAIYRSPLRPMASGNGQRTDAVSDV